MRTSFLSDLKALKRNVLQMGAYIELAIKRATTALNTDDLLLAQEVINDDCTIDDAEREIENLCLKLLLTQQPVAKDMRRISAALKMITDMERIGDFAVDIAEIVVSGGKSKTAYPVELITRMGEAVIEMVDGAVLSFTDSDLELAKRVCKADDEVDALFSGTRKELLNRLKEDEDFTERALDLMMVSKYLERIGDHATNIAEWVIFSITGVHQSTEKKICP